jgi:spoIIIJ-associated protein
LTINGGKTLKQEIIVTAKTVDLAIQKGASELGVSADEVKHEVIVEPKKGFLGIGSTLAEVKVIYDVKPENLAVDFIKQLISNMELDASIEVTSGSGNDKNISIMGEKAGVLIGHHGETLDALQYLVNLVANRKENEEDDRDYTKITVDIENYRNKRTVTLEALAQRMAAKVLKYKKSVTLEPMTPYERRIIHSTIQKIEGVSTNSIGSDSNRRVVIFLEKK